jgi:periplasmic divalent cation tolerance protein
LVIKAREDKGEALAERVRALHPYALPEVIASKVTAGSAAYLAWVRGE